jgi:hypothetical protein
MRPALETVFSAAFSAVIMLAAGMSSSALFISVKLLIW